MIKLEDVSFKYTDSLVLKNINLEIRRGDYVALVGANGSSKSTLVKLMLGILKPLSGKVFLFGQEQSQFKDWSKIAYVRQNANVVNRQFPANVTEIVRTGLYPLHKSIKNPEERIEKVLKLVGAWDYRLALIGNLSGGQQQKVFIARALIGEPELLILDEPMTGVDFNSSQQFYHLLSELNQYHDVTIVMISHDENRVLDKINRLIVMENGSAKEVDLSQYKGAFQC